MNRQDSLMRRPSFAERRIGRIVAKLCILDQVPDHVDAETINPFPKPKAHHIVDGLTHGGIAPIQVRLLGQEGVVVVLPGRGVVLPGTSSEFRKPVVGWTAIGCRIAPDVPIALGVFSRMPAFDEPWM